MPSRNLTDLVELERLQSVQDGFSEATGLAAILVDYRGKPVTEPSGFTPFCHAVREDPERREACFSCDAHGGLQAALHNGPFLYQCHTGLVDFAVPLMLGDEYLGAMMCGQIRLPDAEEKELPNMAGLQSTPLPAELEALRDEVPVTPLRRVRAAAETLDQLMSSVITAAHLEHLEDGSGSRSRPTAPVRKAKLVSLPMHADQARLRRSAAHLDIVALRRALEAEDLPAAVAVVRRHLDELFQDTEKRIGRGLLRPAEEDILRLARETHHDAAAELTRRVGQNRSATRFHVTRFGAEEHLVGLVFCFHGITARESGRRPRTVADLVNRIERAPTAFLTLQSAARYLSFSPHHLSRVFKAHTGTTFMDYVMAKRIERATFLLAHTDEPVLQIASALSFRPANYFSRAFKTHTGMTPSTFRRARAGATTSPPVEDTG